jgi:hypothetical protein
MMRLLRLVTTVEAAVASVELVQAECSDSRRLPKS